MAGEKTEKTKGLTPRRQRFVERYCVHGNGTKAAIEAGYSEKSAERISFELLNFPQIRAAIAAKQQVISEKSEIEAIEVLKRMFDIATADPNELIAHRIGACRFCYGEHHAFQWIDTNEFADAIALAAKSGQMPTHEGGYGFDPRRAPHKDCPKCFGIGVARIEVADTKALKGKAALLYAGVKATKYGVEILMHDQLKSLEMVARHLGMFSDNVIVKGDQDNPVRIMIEAVQGNILRPIGQKSILDGARGPMLDLSAVSGSTIGPAVTARREGAE